MDLEGPQVRLDGTEPQERPGRKVLVDSRVQRDRQVLKVIEDNRAAWASPDRQGLLDLREIAAHRVKNTLLYIIFSLLRTYIYQ